MVIASDDGLEDEETFSLTLGSSEPDQIIIGFPAITDVVIMDIDGKPYVVFSYIYWVLTESCTPQRLL